MDAYFSEPMDIGRYKMRTRGEIFAEDRRYFDSVLYKNMRFRHEYAAAYAQWLKDRSLAYLTPPSDRDVLSWRIAAGIRHTGEAKVRRLFSRVISIVRDVAVDAPLPPDVNIADTMPGGRFDDDPRYAAPMTYLKKFWLRLALPEVRDEA